jgi:hypothetical protein
MKDKDETYEINQHDVEEPPMIFKKVATYQHIS